MPTCHCYHNMAALSHLSPPQTVNKSGPAQKARSMPVVRLPVGISRHVLEDALHAHFQACAAVAQHVLEVWGEAVIRPRLDGQADALGAALLAVGHSLRWLGFHTWVSGLKGTQEGSGVGREGRGERGEAAAENQTPTNARLLWE